MAVWTVLSSEVGEQNYNNVMLKLDMTLSFSKKRKMDKKHSANEKLLYHGTTHDVAEAIRHQNFDSRLCGKNATFYGKGAYFSISASCSHIYSTADSTGHYYMFIAQVLTGRYTAVRNTLTMLSYYHVFHQCFMLFLLWDTEN